MNKNLPLIILISITLIIPLIGVAQYPEPQSVPEALLDKIKSDVWIPFMESYHELNAKKMISIHSKDVIRVNISDNSIEVGEDYFKNLENFFNQVKSRGREVDIQFSILSTAFKENNVYQTGYYCFSSRSEADEEFQPRGYGYFNVLLTNKSGTWMLSLDSDKPAQISMEEFRAGDEVYSLQ